MGVYAWHPLNTMLTSSHLPPKGDESLFTEACPLLDVMGKASFFLGDVGAGANMKLIVNMVRYCCCGVLWCCIVLLCIHVVLCIGVVRTCECDAMVHNVHESSVAPPKQPHSHNIHPWRDTPSHRHRLWAP